MITKTLDALLSELIGLSGAHLAIMCLLVVLLVLLIFKR